MCIRDRYKLKAELFDYSDEQGDVFDSDEELVDYGYTVKHYYLTSAGTNASGTPVVSNGSLTNIFIQDNGSSYNETPLITISGDGTGATATPTLSAGGVGGIQVDKGFTFLVDVVNSNNIKFSRSILKCIFDSYKITAVTKIKNIILILFNSLSVAQEGPKFLRGY